MPKVEAIVPLPLPPVYLKLPSLTVPALLSLIEFKVQKLLVGLSFTASPVPKLFGVKLLPLPLESLPSVVAVVPELSEKFK